MRINFRPFLIIFIITAIGVLFSLIAFFALPCGIALLVCLAVLLIFSVVYFAVKSSKLVALTLGIALVLTALCSAHFLIVAFADVKVAEDETYYVTGRVTEHYSYDDGVFFATLDNLVINGEKADGNLNLTINKADEKYNEIVCGYTLNLPLSLYPVRAIDDEINASAVRSSLKYRAYANADEVDVIEMGEARPLESVRLGLREHLLDVLGNDVGSVTYGMIAGDRFLLGDEISESFSSAGIGHILAVSGLHVGLIALLMTKLLSRLPLPKNLTRLFMTSLLLLYVIFTGGSPSAIRAFVMCAVSIWAEAFGRYDGLNSLALAGVVCLCSSPYYLFECGFLMSLGATLSIICLTKPVSAFFMKIRLPKPVSNSLGVTVSAGVGVFPLTALFFHRLYIYSLPVNAVMMSVLSGLFSLTVLTLPFSFFFALPLQGVGILTQGVIELTKIIGALPFAQTVLHVGVGVIGMLFIIFFISEYVMIKKKWLFNILAVCLAVGLFAISGNELRPTNSLIAVGGADALTVITTESEAYLFGRFGDCDSVINSLDRARIGSGMIAYVTSLDEKSARTLSELHKLRRIKEVRFASDTNANGLKLLLDAGVKVTEVVYGDEIVDVAIIKGKKQGWIYSAQGRRAYVTDGSVWSGVENAVDVLRLQGATDVPENKIFVTAYDSDGCFRSDYYTTYVYDFISGELREA